MHAVTIIAGWSNNEPVDHECAAVDAVEVLLCRQRLVDMLFLHQIGVGVAFGAGERQLELVGARLWILG